MGSSPSKDCNREARILCKERTQYIKQAIEARYALSAAHLSYIQSLRTIGLSIRQYTESQLPLDHSLSTCDVIDKSPSHSSSLASPSHGESPSLPAPISNISYMKSNGGGDNSAVTITINPGLIDLNSFHQESPDCSPLPPPPPLPPDLDSNWDYFNPNFDTGVSLDFNRLKGLNLKQIREAEVVPLIEQEKEENGDLNGLNATDPTSVTSECKVEGERDLCNEREDESEFITHRAKDFLSSVKEIEHRFVRAAEAGDELSQLLETDKIKLSISSQVSSGKSQTPGLILAINRICCKREILLNQEFTQHATKVITWKRSVSSLSSSSKDPLTHFIKDGNNDFIDQLSMISGSHSSTLERLYAWEIKLHDEVKASEYIRRAYDQKCSLLRNQFARDLKTQSIDKTRAIVKDLHSRLCVAIQAVDSISKRIEKMRDEELQPQLVELIQRLIKMWKSMLECHHAQFITISLAYHIKTGSGPQTRPSSESGARQESLLNHLLDEMECFASAFVNWVNAHKSYVESLDSWLQKCILKPREKHRGRRKAIFPPPQALSPPIFVLCSDWLTGFKSLPTDELIDSIKAVVSTLRDSQENKEKCLEKSENESEVRREIVDLESLQSGLRGVFDRLTRFAEVSLKLYEEVMHGNELARTAYNTMVESGNRVFR